MKRAVYVALSVVALATPAFAQTPQTNQQTNPTTSGTKSTNSSGVQAFLTEAATGGMAEVELGTLAAGKASNARVKEFGQRMVTDHGKANEELKALAARKNITLPQSLDAKHKAEHDRLAAMSGAAFDRAYVTAMVNDHQKDVAEFKKQAASNADPDVKAWAAKTLPTLQEHLQMIESIDKETKASSSSAQR